MAIDTRRRRCRRRRRCLLGRTCRNTYILDETTATEDIQSLYQLCDIHQPEIRAIIDDPTNIRPTFDVRSS